MKYINPTTYVKSKSTYVELEIGNLKAVMIYDNHVSCLKSKYTKYISVHPIAYPVR